MCNFFIKFILTILDIINKINSTNKNNIMQLIKIIIILNLYLKYWKFIYFITKIFQTKTEEIVNELQTEEISSPSPQLLWALLLKQSLKWVFHLINISIVYYVIKFKYKNITSYILIHVFWGFYQC